MNIFTLSGTGDVLIGAGLAKLSGDLNTAFTLLGAGVALKIAVALFQKFNIPVSTLSA